MEMDSHNFQKGRHPVPISRRTAPAHTLPRALRPGFYFPTGSAIFGASWIATLGRTWMPQLLLPATNPFSLLLTPY